MDDFDHLSVTRQIEWNRSHIFIYEEMSAALFPLYRVLQGKALSAYIKNDEQMHDGSLSTFHVSVSVRTAIHQATVESVTMMGFGGQTCCRLF